MERNRKKTEEKFLDAVHTILFEEGYAAVGVNAVAEKAGVNKVLLYRYFGGLDGLLERYVARMDPFPNLIRIVQEKLTPGAAVTVAEVSRILFSAFETAVIENPSFAEILKWEIVSENPLTKKIAETREQNGVRLTEYLKNRFDWPEGKDVEAILAVLTGGLFYLWLRKDTADYYNGVPLNRPEGRKRLLQAATDILESIFQAPAPLPENGREIKTM